MINLNFSFKCAGCGDTLIESHSELIDGGARVTIQPHDCKPTEKLCTLSEALLELGEETVEVAYYKKGGDFRVLTGYFPGSMAIKSKIGYEFFLEGIPGGFAPKNLIRRGISSITRLSDGFVFIV